jgi:hypothetical protein
MDLVSYMQRIVPTYLHHYGGWNSSVSIVTRVRDGRPVFKFPPPLGRPWGPSSVITSGCLEFLSRGISSRSIKLTTHLHLVPRLRLRGAIPALRHTSSLPRCIILTDRMLVPQFITFGTIRPYFSWWLSLSPNIPFSLESHITTT